MKIVLIGTILSKKIKYFMKKMNENRTIKAFLVQNQELLSMVLNQVFEKIFIKLTLLNPLDCILMGKKMNFGGISIKQAIFNQKYII